MVHLVLIKDEFRLDLCSELRIDKTTFVSIENGFFFLENNSISVLISVFHMNY